jgi:hypothetical protein
MTAAADLEGGCPCREIRYRLLSEPFDAGYCHCRICRQASDAPFLAFATVPLSDFEVAQGELQHYKSSEAGRRGMCPNCGTQLTIQVAFQPDTLDFTVASLNTPDLVVPTFHIWWKSRVAWTTGNDGLPRFDGFRPNTRGLE